MRFWTLSSLCKRMTISRALGRSLCALHVGRTWIIVVQSECGSQPTRNPPVTLTSRYLCSCSLPCIDKGWPVSPVGYWGNDRTWLKKLGHKASRLSSCCLLDQWLYQAVLWKCPFGKEPRLAVNTSHDFPTTWASPRKTFWHLWSGLACGLILDEWSPGQEHAAKPTPKFLTFWNWYPLFS